MQRSLFPARAACFLLLLTVGLIAGPASAADPAPPIDRPVDEPMVLVLTAAPPASRGETTPGNLLIRELVRQAVLMAARDGLGTVTRDQALREPMTPPEPARGLMLDVFTESEHATAVHVRIERTVADQQRIVWEKSIAQSDPGAYAHIELAAALEPMIRGELVDVLTDEGLAGAANQWRGDEIQLSPDLEDKVNTLSFFSQYAALRQAHNAIRSSGETPALLGALVRVYGNLGQLTRYHFNSSYKVFRARSMLYARRLIARMPDSPSAHWHDAYALTLAGLHTDALDSLARADELAAAQPQIARPAWVDAVKAMCHFDQAALQRIADTAPAQRHLAMFFMFHAIEHDDFPNERTLEVGELVLAVNPDAYRVMEAMTDAARWLRRRDELADTGAQRLAQTLIPTLTAHRDLPQMVRDVLPAAPAGCTRAEVRRRVALALVSAGEHDDVEPSWAVLGRLIEETNFRQIQRKADYLSLHPPRIQGFLESVRPALAGHPYAAIVESYGRSALADYQGYAELFKDLDSRDEHMWMRLLSNQTEPMRSRKLEPFVSQRRRMYNHADALYDETAMRIWLYDDPTQKAHFADWLIDVSIHAPLRYATLIAHRPDAFVEHEQEWVEQYGHHYLVQKALAQRYVELDRYADAERYFKLGTEQRIDYWSSDGLARCYLARGEERLWKQTLDQFLAHHPQESHYWFRVQHSVARAFLEQGQFDKAWPYAKTLADRNDPAHIYLAVDCAEGRGDYVTAEILVRDRSESRFLSRFYAADWYFWCRRTGRGDVEAARDCMREQLKIRGHKLFNAADTAVFHLLEGRADVSAAEFGKAFAFKPDPWDGLHAAMMADLDGDEATRDRLIHEVIEFGPTYKDHPDYRSRGGVRTEMIQLAKLFQGHLADPEAAALTVAAVDHCVAGADGPKQTNLYYFAGRFFANRGENASATQCLSRCVTFYDSFKLNVVLAAALLRELGTDPQKLRAERVAEAQQEYERKVAAGEIVPAQP